MTDNYKKEISRFFNYGIENNENIESNENNLEMVKKKSQKDVVTTKIASFETY